MFNLKQYASAFSIALSIWSIMYAPARSIAVDQDNQRSVVSLDGAWESASTNSNADTEPSTGWQNVTTPTADWHGPHDGPYFRWYRRDIDIPQSWSNRRVFIDARGAKFAPAIYVNGKKAGAQYNGWSPLRVEITNYITAGVKNRIDIRCSGSAIITNKDGKYIAPAGGYKGAFGIWDDIRLITTPKDRIKEENLIITPSVRNKRLNLEGDIQSTNNDLWMEAVVRDNNTVALTIPANQVRDGKWNLSQPFANAHYWSPEDPHLYNLDIILRQGKSGPILDQYTQRFGFKEIWTSGSDIYLNTAKRHFLASSCWPLWTPQTKEFIKNAVRQIKESNVTAFRFHNQPWPETWLDEADEQGLLVVDETPVYTDSGEYAYTSSELWENYKDVIAGMIKRDRNHASLGIISIGNEILFMGNQRFDNDLPKKLGDMARFARSIDTAHPLTMEADQDPDGAFDIIGLHYPHEMPGVFAYPNTGNWVDQRITTDAGGGLLGERSTSFKWDRKKPLYIGEYLWIPQTDYSNGSIFNGDEAYLNRDFYNERSKALAFFDQSVAYRVSNVSGLGPWSAFDGGVFPIPNLIKSQKLFYTPLAAFIVNRGLRFFSSEKAAIDFDVLSDDDRSHQFTLQLRSSNGKVIASKALSLEAGGYERVSLPWSAPSIINLTQIKIDSVLLADGHEVFRSHHLFKVYPTASIVRTDGKNRIYVYGGSNSLIKMTHANAIRSGFSKLDPKRDILVIGANALPTPPKTDKEGIVQIQNVAFDQHAFIDFLKNGGRVMVLEQETLDPLGLGLRLVNHASTMTFPLRRSHPILNGMEDIDLKYWRGDNFVSQLEIVRPDNSGARAIAVSGGKDVLNQSPIMEMNVGAGHLILIQALAEAKLMQDPIAGKLIGNTIKYLSALKPAVPANTAAYVPDAFDSALKNINLKYSRSSLAKNIVIDGDGNGISGKGAALKHILSSGGTVYWHAPNVQAFTKLASVLSAGSLQIVNGTRGTSLKDREAALLTGVSREDTNYHTSVQGPDRTFRPLANAISSYLGAAGNGNVIGQAVSKGNNSLEYSIDVPTAGIYPLIISAKSNRDPVQICVCINDIEVTWLDISKETGTYETPVYLSAGNNTIKITSDNRDNLNIQSIDVKQAIAYPKNAQVLVQPSALVTWPVGNGRVVIDCMNWQNTGDTKLQGARYASALFANLGFGFNVKTSKQGMPMPLTAFKLQGDSPYFGLSADQIDFRSGGLITMDLNIKEAGRYGFALHGYSTPCQGVYCIARFSVDGKVISNVEVKSDNEAEFDAGGIDLTPGAHKLGIEFTNDAYVNGEDRNLFITGVNIGKN